MTTTTTTTAAASAKAPAKLAREGKRLWVEITGGYDLRADEVRILGDACREADIVERLEDQLRDAPLMVTGSQGQLVASPLVSEVRQHRTVLAALLKALKLPDTDSQAKARAVETSEKARAAARARWERPRSA